MDITQFSQINPPQRLLMGPGPINADPRVLRAMASQLVGQYDPAMTHYMNEVMALYRGVFRTENRWTMLVDGTSRAGIEAILVSAIRPGDKVLVPVFGRFGHLLCEIARRCRAEVHTIEVPWGEVFTPDQVEDAIKRVRPRLLLTVQGDTSTTMLQPLAELGVPVLLMCEPQAHSLFPLSRWQLCAPLDSVSAYDSYASVNSLINLLANAFLHETLDSGRPRIHDIATLYQQLDELEQR